MIEFDAFDQWLDARGRSVTTRRAYARALNQVGGVSVTEARTFFEANAKKSPSTLQVTRAALRAYATWQGTEDPTRGLAIRRPRETLPRPMPMPDVERLLAQVPETAVRDRVMLQLMLHGLRRHEVVGLRLTDVSVLVDGPSYADDATLVLRFAGKGAHEAEVVLNRATGRLLAEYIVRTYSSIAYARTYERRAGEGMYLATVEDLCRSFDDTPVFGGVTDRWVNRMFAKYRKAAGLAPRWGPHSLRHTCGTELVERQVDIRVVQEVLRHKDIRMTMRYTKVSRGAKARAVERIPIPR